MKNRLRLVLGLVSALWLGGGAPAADWIHWRGPEMTGRSREVGLPETFEVTTAGQGGLIWKQPYGGRSAPLVMKGRLYMIGGYDAAQPTEGERVLCFDADTGKPIWEQRFGVFHTDIVSSRLGWTTLTADPETERVYAHTTAGFVFCFDRDGKILWRRSLTEEFGRISGYGGRIASPIFDSGLVIVGIASSNWGDQARGASRFVAFDGKTGEIVWWSETPFQLRGTYASNPVIAVINGQRLLISGGADGYLHAFKVRTGERVWSYRVAGGVINPAPVVDGNLVYIAHGETNPEGGLPGRVVCVDASQVTSNPTTKEREPKRVWEQKLGKRFGLSSPAIADGRLYMPEDGAELYCFDGKTGRVLWRTSYGSTSRGAPLIADGKLYIFEVNAKLSIYELKGNEEPEELDKITFRRTGGVGFVETHGTPIAVNGRIYFLTADAVYCVGEPKAKSSSPQYKPLPPETPHDPNAAPVAIRIYPADLRANAGDELKVEVKFLDANGREVKAPSDAKVEWSLPQPPLPPTAPKGASQPPALNGELKPAGNTATVTLGKLPRQQGYIAAKVGNLTARARVRVAADIPYREDFEKTPIGAAPAGYVNAQGKYVVVEKDGQRVLSKVNTNSHPSFSRANAFVTGPWVSGYTIEADVLGTEVRGKMPDIGIVANRYTMLLDGKSDSPNNKRQVRVVSWDARERVAKSVEYHWEPGVWYRLKLTVEVGEKGPGQVRAKVWKKGESEPSEWTVTFEDPNPNREGAAALYAYISDASITPENPGSEALFDNVTITPNSKK